MTVSPFSRQLSIAWTRRFFQNNDLNRNSFEQISTNFSHAYQYTQVRSCLSSLHLIFLIPITLLLLVSRRKKMTGKGRAPIIVGIDVGTRYCRVGVWDEKLNHVRVLENEYGELKTPSYISFTDTKRSIGIAAEEHLSNTANRVFGKICWLNAVYRLCVPFPVIDFLFLLWTSCATSLSF